MNIWGVFAIALGLAMDAFAVSICKGLAMKKINFVHLLFIAFMFGFFQFAMPIIGYFLGKQFEKYIISIDHWIALCLLVFLGVKMIVEACKSKEEILHFNNKINENSGFNTNQELNAQPNDKSLKETKNKNGNENIQTQKLNLKEIILLSVATSIDALAVGITFAFFKINIWGATAIIGIITFVLCCIGVLIGHLFGLKFKKPAEVAGGIILILMGLKILLEHLGVLVF